MGWGWSWISKCVLAGKQHMPWGMGAPSFPGTTWGMMQCKQSPRQQENMVTTPPLPFHSHCCFPLRCCYAEFDCHTQNSVEEVRSQSRLKRRKGELSHAWREEVGEKTGDSVLRLLWLVSSHIHKHSTTSPSATSTQTPLAWACFIWSTVEADSILIFKTSLHEHSNNKSSFERHPFYIFLMKHLSNRYTQCTVRWADTADSPSAESS